MSKKYVATIALAVSGGIAGEWIGANVWILLAGIVCGAILGYTLDTIRNFKKT